MTSERTLLIVPADATAHAKRFGAQYDAAARRWYVIGQIPRELLNYVPRSLNERFHEVAPQCPLCGAPTRKMFNKVGQPFWSCVAFSRTGCRGLVDYLDYLDDIAPATPLADHLPDTAQPLLSAKSTSEQLPDQKTHPLRPVWEAIMLEATETLGGIVEAERWLRYPKQELQNNQPIKMLGTLEGCDAVLKLLRKVWD